MPVPDHEIHPSTQKGPDFRYGCWNRPDSFSKYYWAPERRTFPDEIARNCYFIDIHVSREEARSRGEVRAELRFPQYGPGESHGIPYRCLTPKGLRNVLVAGRCVSADRPVQGSIRVMPVCLVMGEAAGMAAAHAVRHHASDVHAVDTDRLRERLRQEGAYLP